MNDRSIASGVLEIADRGFGFLRDPKRSYRPAPGDPYVSRQLIERAGLRAGSELQVVLGEHPGRGKGGPPVKEILMVDGLQPQERAELPSFEVGTVVDPHERIRFEQKADGLEMRIVDLLTPVGKGQRALIVAPPRTGKTVLLQQMADSIAVNHPEIYMLVLLIDERPEEVTEMRRKVRGEVVASSNDQTVASHVRTARLMTERAKRLVELGRDVLILLDSITRLGRAFNAWVGSSGRTMTGGLDVRALTEPKHIFGAARKIEGGGSLTTIATALIETGSRMDEFIFQEFKGTGNMELMLTRELANLRLWPAVRVARSGTRKEERLYGQLTERLAVLRRRHSDLSDRQAIELLRKILPSYPTNQQFLLSLG